MELPIRLGAARAAPAASWRWPPLLKFLGTAGKVARDEMRDVFNLGVGLIAVVPEEAVEAAQAAATRSGTRTWILGCVVAGDRSVRFV